VIGIRRAVRSGEPRHGVRVTKTLAWSAAALVATAGTAAAMLASCAQTPTNVPVQTMEQPQNVDVVCLQVLDPTTGVPTIPAIPEVQAACAPVPPNVTGSTLPNHLFALVTQTTRGELAVVDLTSGTVVDEDPGTPGINFLPVGRLPSDVAVTPDGQMTFVGSASPNAPAIYALPSTILLGDSQGLADGGHATIPNLTTWPVCALPQAPGAISILPTNLFGSPPDGGAAGDGGAGGPAAYAQLGYVIVVVLPGDGSNAHPARVVTLDPAPFFRGAGFSSVNGTALPDGAAIAPGSLEPCPLIHYIPLASAASATTPVGPGPLWDDGVPYADGGVDADVPQSATACAPLPDAGGASLAGSPRGGAAVLDTSGPRPILYVADAELPIIHVVDLSDPALPVELTPLVATSQIDPSRVVHVGGIAVSPTTHDYKRFLYAIDHDQGTLIVYDITDPVLGPRVPMSRPHPELDPFQAPDRITFGAPVAAVSFVRHDWPLTQKYTSGGILEPLYFAEQGLICNPNANVNFPAINGLPPDQGPFSDDGANYRNNATIIEEGIGPARLRGIFAFATLSNGSVITIDVDDWDAPCRRPDPLIAHGVDAPSPDGGTSSVPFLNVSGVDALLAGPFSSIAPPEPPSSSPEDKDPYHVPDSYFLLGGKYTNSPVSFEWFFPISAPHRARSEYILRTDQTNGNHAPYLLSVPQLNSKGAPVSTSGAAAVAQPSLVPTFTNFVDPSLQANPTEPDPNARTSLVTSSADQEIPGSTPNIRFAWEVPEVQTDQDWTVTYEGPLPGFIDVNNNPLVVANVILSDPSVPQYETVTLSNANALFCSKGVEDWTLGQQRAQAQSAAMVASGITPVADLGEQVADYVQLTDDILVSTDPYWGLDNSCWTADSSQNNAAARVALCNGVYASTLDPTDPAVARDFPILEAHDDRLVIGRFGTPATGAPGGGTPDAGALGATVPRVVVGADPSNVPFLRLMQCCFHNQVHFNVRTGGQWSVVGTSNGFLHHIVPTGADLRCQPSCDPRLALLNGRAPAVPRPPVTSVSAACASATPPIDRDSVLAYRNPMFSFLVWSGQDPNSGCAGIPMTVGQRDLLWQFSTRGQFTPQALSLAATGSGVSPQSMRFIDSLGQLAIVDGESQGLILIDLDTISEAHTPYF
jgi:hypothetical protein